MNPADTLKLRPDIMLVDSSTNEAASLQAQTKRASLKRTRDGEKIPNRSASSQKGCICMIKIIEVVYCSDTRYDKEFLRSDGGGRTTC